MSSKKGPIEAKDSSKINTRNAHQYSAEDVLKALNVDPNKGLSKEEVEKRLKEYGRNELKRVPPPTMWEQIVEQFQDILVRILLVAACVSFSSTIWMGNLPTIAEQAREVGVENGGNDDDMAALLRDAVAKGRKVHFTPQHRGENRIKYGNILGIEPSRFNQYASEALIRSIVSMRIVKSAEEIVEMDKACDIGYEMHTAAMRACEIGKTER